MSLTGAMYPDVRFVNHLAERPLACAWMRSRPHTLHLDKWQANFLLQTDVFAQRREVLFRHSSNLESLHSRYVCGCLTNVEEVGFLGLLRLRPDRVTC